MATYVRKPLKIDYEKSSLWALSSLGSVGAGPVGVQLFDLANRITHRAHRLELTAGGISLGLPISGSYGSSDYENFRTPRDVNFFDFDGIPMTVRETNVGLYSWTTVSFWGMSVRISGGGLNIPGLSVASGNAQILFSDGRPVGDVTLEVKMPPVSKDLDSFRQVEREDALVLKIPINVLFAFDKYLLKPGKRTEDFLSLIGGTLMNYRTSDFRFLIIGHTDNIGSAEYNIRLSKRRAKTVANWLIEHNYAPAADVKTIGEGFSNPITSNSTEAGRAENRRVEVVIMRTKLWETW